MYVNKRDYDSAIQSIRIDFGRALGQEKDEDCYIVIKEMSTQKIAQLKEAVKNGEEETLKVFKGLLPDAIKEHNLMETETTPMTNKAVVDLIYEKAILITEILEAYTSAAFFIPANKQKEK